MNADLVASVAEIAKYHGPRQLADGTWGEPVPGVDIERYEVYDVENTDILVFWRLPMRPVRNDSSPGR